MEQDMSRNMEKSSIETTFGDPGDHEDSIVPKRYPGASTLASTFVCVCVCLCVRVILLC